LVRIPGPAAESVYGTVGSVATLNVVPPLFTRARNAASEGLPRGGCEQLRPDTCSLRVLRSDARPQHVKDIRPGRLLTKWLPVRILFGDTDILNFEFLYDRLVNAGAAFTGENEPYGRGAAALVAFNSASSLALGRFPEVF
jgi:hypothetical protein